MDFLGIGPAEAIFFILIMLLVLGPADMVKLGRTLGTTLRKIKTSPTWRMIFSTSTQLRNLPNALAREAGIEELRQELKRETEAVKKMREEMDQVAQLGVSKHASLPETLKPPASKPAALETPAPANEFSAWTTPAAPAKPEPFNTILPPARPAAPEPQPDTSPNDSPSQPD